MTTAVYNAPQRGIGHKRHETATQLGEGETIPNEVTEAHLSLGIEGLNESSWTTLLVKHANTYGMKVNRGMLMENIEKRERAKAKGNFFTDLAEKITTMRTGITLDKNIRVLDGYAV